MQCFPFLPCKLDIFFYMAGFLPNILFRTYTYKYAVNISHKMAQLQPPSLVAIVEFVGFEVKLPSGCCNLSIRGEKIFVYNSNTGLNE